MSVVQALRSHSRSLHDRVDAAFGRFDLADRASYAHCLLAHARALAAAEAVLAADAALPAWRPRLPLLAADLHALGEALPDPLLFALPNTPARLGLLYVTEGSRLGGVMLARSVPAELPGAYLGARHLPGEWRDLLHHIEAAGAGRESDWLARVQEGAEAGFGLYLRAAA